MAYDPLLAEVVLFGGYDSILVAADGDTWTFAQGNWTDITSSLATSPPALWNAAMAFDPTLGGVVLFGGRDVGQFYNATWLFNATGWWNITGSSGPSPRIQMAMDYDPLDGYMVGYGGDFSSTSGWVSYNDTWALTSGGWSRIQPTAHRAPPAVAFSPGTWDAWDQYFLVYGGGSIGSCSGSAQTWSFSGGTWTNQTVSSAPIPPVAGGSSGLVYDPMNESTILFAGYPSSAPCANPTNETWAYTGGQWFNLTGGLPIRPTARCCEAMTFDPAARGLLMFGGNAEPYLPNRVNDTWEFEGTGAVSLNVDVPSADAGQTIQFHATTRGIRGPLAWNWTYGDGSTAVNAGPNVSHAFSTKGTFVVRANVTDVNGTVWPGTTVVTVVPALRAAPVVSPLVVDVPGVVRYRANVSGGVLPLQFEWNLSGTVVGRNATGASTIRIPGTYNLELIVHDTAGWAQFGNVTLQSYAALGVVAALTPLVGLDPLNVSGSANLSGGAPPVNPSWSFGDSSGGSVNATNANHTYTTPGRYGATFRAVDGSGANRSASFTVQVLAPPRAYANTSSAIGVAPFAATFMAAAVGGGGSFSFAWNFSDGTPGASGSTVTHTFSATGVYAVRLVATDQYGFYATSAVSVRVVAPLTAGIGASPSVGVAPVLVNLSLATAGGYGALSALWQLGDGTSSNLTVPFGHTYRLAGTYHVSVAVTDAVGDNVRSFLTVTVVDPLRAELSIQPNVTAVGQPVRISVTPSQGLPPFGYRWGGLPADCPIGNVSSGACNSSLGQVDPYHVWVVVSDALGESINESSELRVNPSSSVPPPMINPGGGGGAPGWLVWAAAGAIGALIVATAAFVVLRRARGRSGAPGSPGGEGEPEPETGAPGDPPPPAEDFR